MTPDVVVDIGNSRVKWGWGEPMQTASLPADDPTAWSAQLALLPAADRRTWVVASVHPPRLERFTAWVNGRGEAVRALTHADIRLPTDVEDRTKVGIDRLLNAVAAREFYRAEHFETCEWAVVVDVGSAMTIDLLRGGELFSGGAIVPGPWMMARALHEFTAKLPAVDPWTPDPAPAAGQNTTQAIQSGVQNATLGAVVAFLHSLSNHPDDPGPVVLVTGGGHEFLRKLWNSARLEALAEIPELTLLGIRHVAESLP